MRISPSAPQVEAVTAEPPARRKQHRFEPSMDDGEDIQCIQRGVPVAEAADLESGAAGGWMDDGYPLVMADIAIENDHL